MPLIERVIPIHWAYAIGKQPLPGGHIIRIRRVTQRIRHIQIQPRVTIKQRPCHVIVLVEIIRVRAFRMEAQRSRLHQLPHHNGTSDHNRHRQQRPQPRTLPHTRRIQRHPPQPRTRPPHQYHRQHGRHHADTQRIQRERYTHIRTHRIKRNQRTLRLDNPHAHRTAGSCRMHIQRTWRRHRHRIDRTGPAIDIRTDTNRAQHLLRLSGCLIQRLRRHRIHTNIFRRAIRIDLHICLRRIGDLQQPLVSTFEPRA